jgi:hypothetical protein
VIRASVWAACLATTTVAAHAAGVVAVAMMAGDLPIDTGKPDQGFEGYRFVALNLCAHDTAKAHALLQQAGCLPCDITFVISTWQVGRDGVDKHPDVAGINARKSVQDPFYGLIRHVSRAQWSPAGSNWGHYQDAETEDLVARIDGEFDEAEPADE